jgi:hypothetical protein
LKLGQKLTCLCRDKTLWRFLSFLESGFRLRIRQVSIRCWSDPELSGLRLLRNPDKSGKKIIQFFEYLFYLSYILRSK